MDYQEAINTIKRECCGCPQFPPFDRKQMCHDGCMYGKDECAFSIAISAMKELQEYKQKLIETYGECDELLHTVVDGLVKYKKNIGIETPVKAKLLTDTDVDLWDECKALGTLEEVRAAVEKHKAKKVNRRRIMRDFYDIPYAIKGDCSTCGAVGIMSVKTDYCHTCGQKLDWNE